LFDPKQKIKTTKTVEVCEGEIILRDETIPDILSIDRGDSTISKKSDSSYNPVFKINVYGVYGIISLSTSKYLVLITEALYVGEILTKRIFQINKVIYIPISQQFTYKTTSYLRPKEDASYLDMLDNFFANKTLYFSYDYDLTSNLQGYCQGKMTREEWKSRFYYSESLMQDFIKGRHFDWIAPVISGLVDIQHTLINNILCDFILISRRCRQRAGMRFISRGSDLDGNTSNFAETEQIFVVNRKPTEQQAFSFVQIRGSIPLLWKQKPDMKWEPRGTTYATDDQNIEVCKKHVSKHAKEYGTQVYVNLIDKKGKTQKFIGDQFTKTMQEVQRVSQDKVRYIWFDFHQECKGMKYQNLSKLLSDMNAEMDEIRFYEGTFKKAGMPSMKIDSLQKGVIRTNCMDCLDRTNVVQGCIARRILHQALMKADLETRTDNLAPFEKFPEDLEVKFRDVWTKNADVLSFLYTGTGALKTDFTKTGKRTKKGALNDGVNAVTRYVKNNFFDGYKQNCLDLVLGRLNTGAVAYKKQSIPSIFILVFILIIYPFFIKMVLDTLDTGLFGSPFAGATYKLKAAVFYFLVFALSMFLLLKVVAGNSHRFIEKPINHH
jgi:hypothetical protein